MRELDFMSTGMELYRDWIATGPPWKKRHSELRSRLAPTPGTQIARFNKITVTAYEQSSPAFVEPVLLVPSMINRAYILDLIPGFSLVEYLLRQGFRVYMLDWGVATDEDREIEFDDLIKPAMDRVVRSVLRHSGERSLHLIGYCMGATLSAIYAAMEPDRIHTLVNLLGPIDFSKAGMLADWTHPERFAPELLTRAYGNVPPVLMQSAFQGMRPTAQISKHVKSRKVKDETLQEFFDALEYWAWDNIPFPGRAYNRYIRELYQDNLLIKGELRIHGEPVSLECIHAPILVLTADRDHIVPVASAEALLNAADQVVDADRRLVTVKGGHVAAVVGPSASRQLWPSMATWLESQSTPMQIRKTGE